VVSHGDVTELDAAVREHEGRVRILRFGRSGRSDVRVAGARSERHGVAFEVSGSWNGTCLDGLGGFVPMLGLHNAMNASAAFGAALTLGVDALAALKGMASAEAPAMRLQTRRIGGVTVINDAYNANPDSMLAAIETLAAQRHTGEGRLVAVLGDMLELGPDPASPHLEVAEALAEQGIDLSVLGGESMRAAAERLTERGGACVWLPGFDGEGAKQAAAHIREGDTVLLKGSRKMGVERVEREISARLADEPLAGAR
jgi:UDP-N-acetylmuramoyl-tripeptide--D-alanyl-D-alanine ligase